MKRLKVSIPLDVQQQILEQVLYIAKDSVRNALAWEDRLRIAINGIGNLPGHAIDEEASRRAGETVRKTVFEKTYLIHYRIIESKAIENRELSTWFTLTQNRRIIAQSDS